MKKNLVLVLMACLLNGMTCHAQNAAITKQADSQYELAVAGMTMVVDAAHGGKILSFKYDGAEVISQSRWPESFGSTFWTSPQAEWNWPPVPEYDKMRYAEDFTDGVLTLTSEVSEKLKFRIRKQFRTNPSTQSVDITYTITNEDDKVRKVAPWEITRVANDGVVFFEADAITPKGLLDFKPQYGAVWYMVDVADNNRKINADGKGWLAYCANGLLLVKQFDDLTPSQPAEGEAEVQVYVNRGKTYMELESQGACQALEPGESLSMTVKWYLKAVSAEASPSEVLYQTVKKTLSAQPLH